MTTDAEAAMKFYTELSGGSRPRPMDMGPMGKYHMFGRTFQLGGMMNKPAEMAQVPPNWGIYFRVADINAAAERVKANGGQILNGRWKCPGGDRIVNCMDPQGAAFSSPAQSKCRARDGECGRLLSSSAKFKTPKCSGSSAECSA